MSLPPYWGLVVVLIFNAGRPFIGGSNPGGNCGSGRANSMRVALLAFAEVKASAVTGVSSCQFVNSI
jgi:hypothetical protein